ncbi:MAG: ATPase, T2SS/T4P/T4SS family [Patescibacteria group bacterium]
MIKQDKIIKALVVSNTIKPDQLKKIQMQAKTKKLSLEEYLVNQKIISESKLYELVAKELGLPFVDLKNTVIRKDILLTIPEPIAQTHNIIAFNKDKESIKVATLDPEDLQTFEFIEKKFGTKIIIHLTTPSAIKDVIKQYHKSLQAEFEALTKEEIAKEESTGEKLQRLAEDIPVVRMVDTLLEYAIFERASDIHIEPTDTDVIVRYRIDGLLRDVMTLPKNVQSGLVARIKILSSLKLDEHRLPQDGRFKIKTKDYEVSFRVSIIPVFNGEKIVMRLLQESGQILTLEQLGLDEQPLQVVKRNIDKPHGMILVTGPTGSGKTTTLYSIMHILNKPEVNISTIEDPIEYRMPRINQSQVNPRIGFTFANGLRSLLRQDPDIIMVGEIRDTETAEIAIHSAMTGHLVLSTLHTNDAVGTLPRLSQMGIPSFLISSTVNVVVAQRLMRKLCQECKVSYHLSKSNVNELSQKIDIDSINKSLSSLKVLKGNEKLEQLSFYHSQGCKQCNNQGYKGRVGIYEVLEVTPAIAELILSNSAVEKLQSKAIEQGMIPLLIDGFYKAIKGLTSIEEILRVTKE